MKKLLFLVLALFAAPVFAGNVQIIWEPPTECADESPLDECPITGYQIFMGTSPTGTAYNQRSEKPAVTATSITLTKIPAGNKCFYMKTESGTLVSGESNRVCVNVPAPGPKAPRITVTVVVSP